MILLTFGTRPEAIKMAPVIHELQRRKLPFKVCVTAQHREMLDQVLDLFEIQPDYDLDLMVENQSLNEFSGKLFLAIDKVLGREKPTIVLVHGDTISSSIVALAAFYKEIKVGHVEAGLRTYDPTAPFPEEVNRQITARTAYFHFAPTEKAVLNLKKEQIASDRIFLTGNTVVDSIKWAAIRMTTQKNDEVLFLEEKLSSSKKTILVTGHRRENFGQGLENICKALITLAARGDVEVVFPVHLNPKVKVPVYQELSDHPHIFLIPPVGYLTMLWLIQRAELIITDSGGMQEEAPSFGKPTLVTRACTERSEAVEAGFSMIVGTSAETIIKEALRLLNEGTALTYKSNPFGDGTAAKTIVDILVGSSEL